jgi:hypothetical protein
MRRRKIILWVILGGFCVLAISYLSLVGYPRIIRSAYYANPYYAVQAFGIGTFTRCLYSKNEALQRVKQAGLVSTGTPRFLYLIHSPHSTAGEKPIIDRYFGLLTKVRIQTNASSFWECPVEDGRAFVEVDGQRIIYLVDHPGGITTPKYLQ